MGLSRVAAAISPRLLFAAVAAGLGLRLWLAIGNYGNYDMTSWRIVAEIAGRGGNVYAETTRYNYSPLWAWVLWGLAALAGALAVPLHAVIKVFLTLVDAGNIALVGSIAGRERPGSGRLAAAVYALHPVAIMLVGHHGQLEPLAALPLLAAVLLCYRPAGSRPAFLIWGLLTAALLAKHIVIFVALGAFVSLCRGYVRPLLAFGASLAVLAASFLPYVSGGREGIVRNIIGYGAMPGRFGFAAFLRPPFPLLLLFGTLTVLPFVARDHLRMRPGAITSLLGVGTLMLMPRCGEAYVLLPAVFGAILGGFGSWVFMGVAYYFLLHGVNNLQALDGPPPATLLWLSLVLWFVWLVKDALRRRREEGADPSVPLPLGVPAPRPEE